MFINRALDHSFMLLGEMPTSWPLKSTSRTLAEN